MLALSLRPRLRTGTQRTHFGGSSDIWRRTHLLRSIVNGDWARQELLLFSSALCGVRVGRCNNPWHGLAKQVQCALPVHALTLFCSLFTPVLLRGGILYPVSFLFYTSRYSIITLLGDHTGQHGRGPFSEPWAVALYCFHSLPVTPLLPLALGLEVELLHV